MAKKYVACKPTNQLKEQTIALRCIALHNCNGNDHGNNVNNKDGLDNTHRHQHWAYLSRKSMVVFIVDDQKEWKMFLILDSLYRRPQKIFLHNTPHCLRFIHSLALDLHRI
jgi:hypothetical protein